jgi:hypothetical protein
LHVIGQPLAEKSRGRDDQIGVAQPGQRQIAQAGAHRIAHEQRAGQHGHGGRHAEDYREVRAPVMSEIMFDECYSVHCSMSQRRER